MCKVISISNQKGGVAKTVTSVNMGIGLAREGKKVLFDYVRAEWLTKAVQDTADIRKTLN